MSHHPLIFLCYALFPVDAHRRRPYVRRLADNVAELAVLGYVSFCETDVLPHDMWQNLLFWSVQYLYTVVTERINLHVVFWKLPTIT